MIPKLPTGSDILPPTAPIGDFNNAILDTIHARPLELLFGIPVLVLLTIAAVMLVAMWRHAR
jgi:hypothetical protein